MGLVNSADTYRPRTLVSWKRIVARKTRSNIVRWIFSEAFKEPRYRTANLL